MHVGSLNPDGSRTQSKTEAMYFPATPKTPTELATAKADLIFGSNNKFYIPFTACFKYLGCCIHESLRDDEEILHHLQVATQQAAALQNFWHSSADIKTKWQIFLAIPVNTALYGCESWTLTADLSAKISAFFHRTICRILGITMHHVHEFHIRNEHICNRLSVPDPLDIVHHRQFNQIGKFACLPDHRIPRQFLTSWVARCRQPAGRTCYNLRKTYVHALQHVLDEGVDDSGLLATWLPMAQSQESWEALSHDWIKQRTAYTLYHYGCHPLLEPGVCEDKYIVYFPAIHTAQTEQLMDQQY